MSQPTQAFPLQGVKVIEIGTLIAPRPSVVVDVMEHTFNVFHVPNAVGSPYIPAQEDFVIP